MRRSWFCALVGAVCVLMTTPARADLAEVKQRGTLRVLVSADELPEVFAVLPSEQPGLEREMLEAFARAHGLELEIVTVETFDRIIPALTEGRGDLIVGIVDTESRREAIAFTAETLPARHVVVSRKPAPSIQSLEQLRASRVGSVPGSSWAAVTLAAGVDPGKLTHYPSRQALFEGLSDGAIEAAVMTLPNYAHAFRRDAALQAGVFVGEASSLAWGVRQDDVELRRALSGHLEALRRSPSFSRLVLRYLTEDALRLLAKARE